MYKFLSPKSDNITSGFTSVELMITLLIAALFVISFSLLYTTTNSVQSSADHRSQASAIAYSNLRKYTSSSYPSWFTCDSDSLISVANPNPPGQILLDNDFSDPNLASPHQKVAAFAPHSCGNDTPVLVISSVTYGASSNRQTVTHTTYVGN
jgi:hypothetical protein